jgi:hypothetical protein
METQLFYLVFRTSYLRKSGSLSLNKLKTILICKILSDLESVFWLEYHNALPVYLTKVIWKDGEDIRIFSMHYSICFLQRKLRTN